MDPRRPREPDPVEIVLVAVEVTRTEVAATRPPPAGAGTMPPVAHLIGHVAGHAEAIVTRIATVPDPPLLPGRDPARPGSDQRLHRLVRRPPWEATEALHQVLLTWDGSAPASNRPPPPRRLTRWWSDRWSGATRPARIELVEVRPPFGLPRLRGELHVHRWRRPTPVELTLTPWSAFRTDLCLQPTRGRFGARLPRRYYDVAHRVMDELWHLIERAAA